MKIGSYTFTNNLSLAPMAGVTDRVFRDICRDHGVGYVVGEMLSAKLSLNSHKHAKTSERIVRHDEAEPRAIQLLGNEPTVMAKAAQYNVAKGAQIIDINMGCPAKKVCSKAAGSALMRDIALVTNILESVVNAVNVPVTLKIRTGWSDDFKNAVEIAKIAENSGIQALAVHGRTRAQKFMGDAEYDTIAEIKSAITHIPIIANGDIDSPEKAKHVLDYTQADGLMIGRHAQGNPWIFKQITHFLSHGTALAPPTAQEKKTVMHHHLTGLHELYGEFKGIRIARKHIAWYLGTSQKDRLFLREFYKLENAKAQHGAIDAFLTPNFT